MDKQSQQYHQMPEPTIKPINYIPTGVILLLDDHPDEVWVAARMNGFFKYEKKYRNWTITDQAEYWVMTCKACVDWSKEMASFRW